MCFVLSNCYQSVCYLVNGGVLIQPRPSAAVVPVPCKPFLCLEPLFAGLFNCAPISDKISLLWNNQGLTP